MSKRPVSTRVTDTGLVFTAAPTKDHLPLPKRLKGSKKPIDILLRKPGQCAAVVASEGWVHYVCGMPTGRAGQDFDYCSGHNFQIPTETGPKELIRSLRRYYMDRK